ncbi:MAG: molybdate ABC transporter substrate-binding protein [Bacillota bacterium]|nr:molybdate ABC transporter substrate-binding protein [Bacillota bacterium]
MLRLNNRKLMIIILSILITAFCITGCGNSVQTSKKSQSITVFAAASLTESFNEIGKQFEKDKGIKVVFNFAGSQALVTSINEGGKADVFASANTSCMEDLKKSNKVDKSIVFAKNQLVICKNKDSKVNINSLQDLSKKGVKLIAADKSVPAGSYFYKALDNAVKEKTIDADIHSKILNNIKSSELDVKSVVSKIALGEADAGIVYKTDINNSNKDNLDLIELNEFSKLQVEYPVAVVNSSDKKTEAQEFIDYITQGKGKELLKKYGFMVN